MIAPYQRQKKYPCKPLKEAILAMSPSHITSKSNLPTTIHYKLDETRKAIAPAPYTLPPQAHTRGDKFYSHP